MYFSFFLFFFWNNQNKTNNSIACSTSCVTCFGGNNNECLSCPNDLLLEAGLCVTNCSVGNYPDDDKICQGFFRIYIFFEKKREKINIQHHFNYDSVSISMFNLYWTRKWKLFNMYFPIYSKRNFLSYWSSMSSKWLYWF